MKSFHKILFATDFSDCSEPAQVCAFAIAAHFESELHIAHTIDTKPMLQDSVLCIGFDVKDRISKIEGLVARELERTAEVAKASGILNVYTHLVHGPVAEGITDKAQTLGCDLVVISTHGRSGFNNLLIGSNAERIVRLSTIPVLSVKPHEQDFVHEMGRFKLNHILCPYDLSANAEQAVRFAADLCRTFGAKLTLLFVVDSRLEFPIDPVIFVPANFKERALARLKEMAAEFEDIEVDVEVRAGVPATVIVEAASNKSVDLIAMTTYGRSGLSRALLASTAEKVVRTAWAPIITIRPDSIRNQKARADSAMAGKHIS